ncbi:unnamed protein product [Miscanthus lutarioriparius]|uniref:Uncharacterized protein n=1 Tax=Miscanthus lutarioriparius TaxID=422564 RepID=A0A811SNE6_9POAL|nr:unnamed protein product [Miscanthus lutarioriparius]
MGGGKEKDLGSMARAALNKRNGEKKRKITRPHNNTPPETNKRQYCIIVETEIRLLERRKEPSHKDSWSDSDECSWTGPYIVNVRLSRCSDGQYGSMHTCPKVDAMLTVTSDSRKASLGSRLVGRRQLSADASVFLLDQGCLLIVTGGMVRDRVWSGVLWRAGGSRV